MTGLRVRPQSALRWNGKLCGAAHAACHYTPEELVSCFFSNCGISHLLPVPTLQLPSVPQMGVLPAGSHVHLPLVVPHFRVCCASQVGSCRWHDRRVARARSLVCAQ